MKKMMSGLRLLLLVRLSHSFNSKMGSNISSSAIIPPIGYWTGTSKIICGVALVCSCSDTSIRVGCILSGTVCELLQGQRIQIELKANGNRPSTLFRFRLGTGTAHE